MISIESMLLVLLLWLVVLGAPIWFVVRLVTEDSRRSRRMAAQWREMWSLEEEGPESKLLRPVNGKTGENELLRPSTSAESDLLRPLNGQAAASEMREVGE